MLTRRDILAHVNTVNYYGAMTQTQNPGPVAFEVVGKDRLSDPWITQRFSNAYEADRWATERAFVLPDGVLRVIRPVFPQQLKA
jgi:hypothetical protein